MPVQTPVPILRNDRLLFVYTSLTQGNNVDSASIQLQQPFEDVLRSTYGANRPICSQFSIQGQTLGTFTTNFGNECGFFNPDVIFVDGTPNDLAIIQATLDAFWAKAVDVTQYKRNKLPKAVVWMSLCFRNDESFGGANQTQIQTDNALAAARGAANSASFANGVLFCDVWAYWATRARFRDNPSNLGTGVYTLSGDGTHLIQKGGELYRDALLGTGLAGNPDGSALANGIVTSNGSTGVLRLVT